MTFKRGDPKLPNSGRKPGSVNKLGQFAKEEARKVFDQLGGTAAFKHWAEKNQSEFYCGFIARSMPKEIDISGNITHDFDFNSAVSAFERALDDIGRARRIEEEPPKLINGDSHRRSS